GAQHALARAGLLDLRNDGGAARGDLAAQGAFEVAREHAAFRIRAHRLERHLRLRGGDFLALDRDDLVEDVRHQPAAPFVNCTSWSSFLRAAPLSIAVRALSMPASIDGATFAA